MNFTLAMKLGQILGACLMAASVPRPICTVGGRQLFLRRVGRHTPNATRFGGFFVACPLPPVGWCLRCVDINVYVT